MSDDVEFRRLSKSDPRQLFDCGNRELNEFLRQFARQQQDKKLSETTIATRGSVILGSVTLVVGSVKSETLLNVLGGLRTDEAPILLLARMGADLLTRKPHADERIGERLLREVVFQRAWQLNETTGCVGVVTDAKSDSVTNAVGFYQKYDFLRLDGKSGVEPEGPQTRMLLPIDKVPKPAPPDASP